jgi:hypothetical protein
MSAIHTKKLEANMSQADRAARERRVARAVKAGTALTVAARNCGVSEKEARRICDAMGIKRPVGRKS